ncbi:MAG TPA: hypothetical protein VJ810_20110, partial [Blastocatellia bacterium]|nr:hypothetical protein [Blastocatellia bacterium]
KAPFLFDSFFLPLNHPAKICAPWLAGVQLASREYEEGARNKRNKRIERKKDGKDATIFRLFC